MYTLLPTTPFPHFHIRWSGIETLDWQVFGTQCDAEDAARDRVRPDETYTIEEHSGYCVWCKEAAKRRAASSIH